jgi:peptidyl-prolyl cis-trans isomerase SurA
MMHMAQPAAACRLLIVAMLMVMAPALTARAQTVVAVVNGEPITAIDVDQRMKFIQLSTHKAAAREDVINELIDEKLKVREGKRWGIEITDAEVNTMYASMGSRAHQTAEQLTQNLAKAGVYPNTLKTRIRADSVWNQLVRGRYQASLQLTDREVELAVQAKNASEEDTSAIEYRMRPILLLVPPGASGAVIDGRRKEAEALRGRFKNCEEGIRAARAMRDTAIRGQVIRNSGDLPAPLRKLLDAVPVGQLTAPEVTRLGIEMYAICGKQESKADAPAKRQAREALASQRFEQQSKAYLQRLRREALIERR